MNAPVHSTESTALSTAAAPPEYLPAMPSPGNTALILDPGHMKNMVVVAEIMATGMSTVPQHLRKNRGDCLAVVMQAAQWGMNPFAVAQKTHVVNGTLGYEAQLVNAVVNSMAPTKDRINYEWFGDWAKIIGKSAERTHPSKKDENGEPKTYRVKTYKDEDEHGLGVKVWATMKGEAAPRELTLLLTQARVRNSPLWLDDPKQQLAYLAVKRWTRLHCPDVLLGVYTPDELEERQTKDMGRVEVVEPNIPAELVKQAEAAADNGVGSYQTFWRDTGPANRKLLAEKHAEYKDRAIEADRRRTVDNAKPPAPPAPPSGDNEPKVVTFASVLDNMVKATNPEALDVAADWIGEVADPDQRAELTAKYHDLKAKFGD